MSEPVNPYAAPRADTAPLAEGAEGLQLNHASMGARFLNLILDSVAMQIINQVAVKVLVASGFRTQDFTTGLLVGMVLGLALSVAYYVILEGTFGWTLAKLITGTRVVDTEGRSPTLGQVVGRTFSRFVPFEPFSFFNNPSVGWHDRWSGTRVVKIRR